MGSVSPQLGECPLRRQNLEAEGPAEVTHFTQGETEARGGWWRWTCSIPEPEGQELTPTLTLRHL